MALIVIAVIVVLVLKSSSTSTTPFAPVIPTTPIIPAGYPAAPGTPTAAANAQAASAVGGLATSALELLGTSANLAGPIGSAVSGAVSLLLALRSTTHLVANTFVQQYQNPFGSYLGQIVDWNDNLVRQNYPPGSQTAAGAEQALTAVQQLWSQFQLTMQQFAAKGAQDNIVVQQAMADLNGPSPTPPQPPYFMNLVISNLQNDVTALSNGTTPRAR